MRTKISRLTFWLPAICLLSAACGTDLTRVDDGLFTEKPCKAPGWQNLTPGQSISADVDQILRDL